VLEFKQGKTKIPAHVTSWKELLRRLQEANKDLKFNHTMICVLFLQSLHIHMKPFVTYQMMQEKMEPTKVYQGAIEFEQGEKADGDEAPTAEVALWSHEGGAEYGSYYGKGKGKGYDGKGKGKGYDGKGKGYEGKGKGYQDWGANHAETAVLWATTPVSAGCRAATARVKSTRNVCAQDTRTTTRGALRPPTSPRT
jgi:hypothetical protein